MSERTLPVDHGHLAYDTFGDDGPPVVLVHGITDNRRSYDAVAAKLASSHRVFAYDHRGHGTSSHTDSYQLADYAADAVAFIDGAVGEPVVYVGHSLGGITAQYAAARHPDRFRALVLEDPPTWRAADLSGSVFEMMFTGLRDFLTDLHGRGGNVDEIRTLIASLDVLPEDHVAPYAEGLIRLDVSVLNAALDGTMGREIHPEDSLPKITVPALLLAGREDLGGAMSASDIERTVQLVPRCDAKTFELGHMIHHAVPDDFADAILRFVSRLDG